MFLKAYSYINTFFILQVKRMIKIGLCRGVRFVGHDSGTHLVAWFQTYPDGSCGMLYTLPVSSTRMMCFN